MWFVPAGGVSMGKGTPKMGGGRGAKRGTQCGVAATKAGERTRRPQREERNAEKRRSGEKSTEYRVKI